MERNKMKIKLIDFGGKIPERAHYNDSGADVFAKEDITLNPGVVTKIPIGVGVNLPDGYDIVVHCKSGLSSKGIISLNAPVDAGYLGEIHAIVINLGEAPYEFKKGEKVGQLVVRPVVYADFVMNIEEIGRGEGAFGSTGK